MTSPLVRLSLGLVVVLVVGAILWQVAATPAVPPELRQAQACAGWYAAARTAAESTVVDARVPPAFRRSTRKGGGSFLNPTCGARRARAATAAQARYRRARALDLTGDDQADSVRLDAVGERPDSLRLTLALVVDGTVKHRETWGSSYELALADSARGGGSALETLLRARLDSVLSSVRVQRLDAPGVRVMAEDRAILAALEPPPTHRVSFSYGYETTVHLAWDAPRARFVRLWSCC